MNEILEFGKMFLIGGGAGLFIAILLKINQRKENKKKEDRLRKD